MALLQKREEQQTDLQNRVATQVQKRLRENEGGGKTINDHESAFLENQHQTRKAGMVIMVLLILLMVAIVGFIIKSSLTHSNL